MEASAVADPARLADLGVDEVCPVERHTRADRPVRVGG
jgi:hypothetical protein